MSPPQKRCCHFCYTSFLIQDIDSDGAVPPRVIACTQCGKRWREKSFIRDDGRLHTILEEVDDDVRLTTRSLVISSRYQYSTMPTPEAKVDRMRDQDDVVHPSACHALGATLRSVLEA